MILEGNQFLGSFMKTLIISSDSVVNFALELVKSLESLSVDNLYVLV